MNLGNYIILNCIQLHWVQSLMVVIFTFMRAILKCLYSCLPYMLILPYNNFETVLITLFTGCMNVDYTW